MACTGFDPFGCAAGAVSAVTGGVAKGVVGGALHEVASAFQSFFDALLKSFASFFEGSSVDLSALTNSPIIHLEAFVGVVLVFFGVLVAAGRTAWTRAGSRRPPWPWAWSRGCSGWPSSALA